jgi:hypothetical protein
MIVVPVCLVVVRFFSSVMLPHFFLLFQRIFSSIARSHSVGIRSSALFVGLSPGAGPSPAEDRRAGRPGVLHLQRAGQGPREG